MIKSVGTFRATIIVMTAAVISTVPATMSYTAPRETHTPVVSAESSALRMASALQPDGLDSFDAKAWYAAIKRSRVDDVATADRIRTFKRLDTSGGGIFRFKDVVKASLSIWALDNLVLTQEKPDHYRPWLAVLERQAIAENISMLREIVGNADPLILKDAGKFYSHIRDLDWQPDIWSDDGEIAFEWMKNDKHAIVSFDGDGKYGYAMLHGASFQPGHVIDPEPDIFPDDLMEYLEIA
jgi:hypothetical protein